MSTKNKNIDSQKQANQKDLHNNELGFTVPENYFAKSKQNILNKINEEKKETPVFTLKRSYIWYAAASIVLLVAITLIKPNRALQIEDIKTIVLDSIKQLNDKKNVEEVNLYAENDILITSLFVEENNIDEFIDNYVLDEALIDEAF